MNPASHRASGAAGRRGGFTLLELLVVLAIIAALAAILIPTVHSARLAANKARTRVLFQQWAAAIELFRGEYGHYPVWHGSQLVNGGAEESEHLFHDVLAGRQRDGAPLPAAGAALAQNPRRIAFHAFSAAEFAPAETAGQARLCDPLGNTEIAVLLDRNLDGRIDSEDYGTLPSVAGMRPGADDVPASGIRAGVAFYAALPAATAERPEFIFSWK